MKLLSIKKTIFVAGILSAALYAQQALAWEDPYLYCTKQNPGTNQWDWAKQPDANFVLNKNLNIGYQEGSYLRLQGHYLGALEFYHSEIDNIFLIDNKGASRDLGQAKAVCEEVQKFCPATSTDFFDKKSNDKIYLGAARFSSSNPHQVGVPFKNNPSDQQNHVLLCPSWQYEQGNIDLNCGQIYGPMTTKDGLYHYPKYPVDGLGICKKT